MANKKTVFSQPPKPQPKGPPVYILHGWSYQTGRWRPTLDRLNQLGFNCQILAIPGLTGPPMPNRRQQGMSIDDYTDWFDQQLPSRAGAVVIGHSHGGRIALNYASRHRNDKIKHLVLISSAGVALKSKRILRNRILARLARNLPFLKRSTTIRSMVHKILKANNYQQANQLMKRTLANILASDNQLDLSSVRLPVTLIWGDQDKITPLWQAQVLKDGLTNLVDYQIIKGAGHWPYYSHPDQLCRILVDRLDQL